MFLRRFLLAPGAFTLMWVLTTGAGGCSTDEGTSSSVADAAQGGSDAVQAGSDEGIADSGSEDVVAAADTAVTPDPDGVETPDVPEPPVGPQPTAPPAYSEGQCPALQSGVNTFNSGGHARNVQVYFPSEPVESPAVLYVWHALGANASLFANLFQAQKTANDRGAIVVVPESCCNVQAEWDPVADSALFDDMLRCLLDDHDADAHRVYTTGFSAGGLWSTWLMMNRAHMLAASVLFSGGVAAWLPYVNPPVPVATVAVDGGPLDIYGGVVNFHTMTADLVSKLSADGHTVIHCEHTGAHSIPPGADAWGYPFLFSHRFGEPSPYAAGPDATFPAYCALQ